MVLVYAYVYKLMLLSVMHNIPSWDYRFQFHRQEDRHNE